MTSFLIIQLLLVLCSRSANTINRTTLYSIPPTDVTSVTEWIPSTNCAYYSDDNYTISPSQNIFNVMLIENNAITMEFDLRLYEYCNLSLCNILYIDIDAHSGYLSLSINGIENCFEIAYDDIIYKIPNVDILLSDDEYHHIYVDYQFIVNIWNLTQSTVQIDNNVYYFHGEYKATSPNQSYQLYTGSPYNDNLLKCFITNICIQPSIDMSSSKKLETKCGDTLGGDWQGWWHFPYGYGYYFYLNLSKTKYVSFDFCMPCNDADDRFVLSLYDTNWTQLTLTEYDKPCRYQASLINMSSHGNYYTLKVQPGQAFTGSVICGVGNCDECVDEVSCGTLLKGILPTERDIVYYYFNHTQHNATIIFDSCGSLYDTYLYLYDKNFIMLFEADDDGDCGTRAQMIISSLPHGEYILGISAYVPDNYRKYMDRQWQIEVICGNNVTLNVSDTMYHLINPVSSPTLDWFGAELSCETHYGSSLATVITARDLSDVIKIIINYKGGGLTGSYYRAWIGMIKRNDSNWQWLDGTIWNGTIVSMDCNDNNLDYYVQLDHSGPINQIGAYLTISATSRNPNTAHLCSTDFSTVFTFSHTLALCNEPGSRYRTQACTGDSNCWVQMDCCNDTLLTSDVVFQQQNKFKPPIAHWNGTLFVVGQNYIHYTNIELYSDIFEWNHMFYDTESVIYMTSQKYFQYMSALYVLKDELIHIDLDTLTVSKYKLPEEYFYYQPISIRNYFCLIADANRIYIFRDQSVIMFHINTFEWSLSNFPNIIPAACAITNDNKYIYTFGDIIGSTNPVIKFDTELDVFTNLDIPTLCDKVAISVTGGNDKIYLHGCAPASWQTLIFDINTEQFEYGTIDIVMPANQFVHYYRASRLAFYDDNILLLVHTAYYDDNSYYSAPKENTILIYYAITELIAINFTKTMTNDFLWPSACNKIQILYKVNDFTNSSNSIYYIKFYSNDTKTDIDASIKLNTANDHCICNESIYSCYQCVHYFDLKQYLSIYDNDINTIQVHLSYNSYHFDVLLRPNIITLQLQRCTISVTNINQMTTTDSPFIDFSYNTSENCQSRVGKKFSLHIIASEVNIAKQLIFNILENNESVCKICNIGLIKNNDCFFCNHNKFTLEHETNDLDDIKFNISIISNSIDFQVKSPNMIMQYLNKKGSKLTLSQILAIVGGALFFVSCIILIIYVYCRREYMKAFVVNQVLVLIIGISQFKEKKYLLDGVRKNVKDLSKLWRDGYKYDVFICNEQALYSTKKEIREFIDKHKTRLEGNKYQCVIVHIISHGLDNGDCFWSSDQQTFKIDDIQRELTESAKYDTDTPLIKLIFNHACRGENNYSVGISRGIFGNKPSNDNIEDVNKWEDSNWVIIWGNIKDRTMSDCGDFTQCICSAFEDNLKKIIKANFRTLITEIGINLEYRTNGGEICNMNETLREKRIRFEKATKGKHEEKLKVNNNPTMEASLIDNDGNKVIELIMNNKTEQCVE